MKRKISSRDRSLEDDIRSVRHESTVVRGARGDLSIPDVQKEPLVVWADSVQRESILRDDDVLESCMKWPKKTDRRCHNCTYPFEGVPVPLPVHKDGLRNIYHCSGNFCSWQCAKSFNMRETSPAGRGNRNMYISILAYRMWVKILKDRPSLHPNAKSFCTYKIEAARPRFELRDFGGALTIEEYREGFFGVLPPEGAITETSPLLTLRKLAVVPFIDTDTIKASVQVKNTEQESLFRGIKRMETNRVQEFNNSFCERLRKARDDPTLMKRKKGRDDSNTLLSSMGIEIKKRHV
jgi:hypothetical protein